MITHETERLAVLIGLHDERIANLKSRRRYTEVGEWIQAREALVDARYAVLRRALRWTQERAA